MTDVATARDHDAVAGAPEKAEGPEGQEAGARLTVVVPVSERPDRLSELYREVAAALRERDSLDRAVTELPDETTVWPGHDYGCRPSSTIGIERVTNPFLQCRSEEEFLELKRSWASFKKEHGLA